MNHGDSVGKLIALALEEDLGTGGDVTSQALIGEEELGEARFLVKESLVLAGVGVVRRVFDALDSEVKVSFEVGEGAKVESGQVVGSVCGRVRSILAGERTALNFLQRLSGVATNASRAVEALRGTSCRILDTRKTTPGWRVLEKAAVRAGGGGNHRLGLFDGVLIKDNHIAAVGSISQAIGRVKGMVHHLLKVEVEVTDLAGVEEALAAGVEVIMLDNMDLPTMKRAVQMVAGRAKTEASGGVGWDRLQEISGTGVDYISMGALTHSARAMDISLEMSPRPTVLC